MEEEDIEFDWEVLEVFNTPEKRGATVAYTPVDPKMSAVELFVPVPFHKVADETHALEVMELKINQRAPRAAWTKEITPARPDVSESVTNKLKADLSSGKKLNGQKRKPGNPNAR